MIAFNGQYLPAASHGNMRITAACLGGQLVLGNWLMTATAQAIIAAFGAEEGIAVIRRTNDYLNALALTDPTRAQQLAMFINEDPLLVCSLVETSKTRWLVGDGVAYINTGVKSHKDMYFEIDLKYDEVVTTSQFNGGFGTYSRITIGTRIQGFNIGYGSLSEDKAKNDMQRHIAIIDGKNKKVYVDGIEYDYSSAQFNNANTTDMTLFARSRHDSGTIDAFCKERVVYAKIDQLHLLPFTRNGENGMLDIISGTFHPNANTAGAFTIALTDKQ